MERFILVPLVILALSCAKGQQQGGEPTAVNDWPKGLSLFFEPANRTLGPGGKLRMWIENKTGEEYKYEWVSEGLCGELQYDKARAFEALFIAGKHAQDCREKITFKAFGPNGPLSKESNVLVRGSPDFAELEVRPEPIPESWTMINDFDKTLIGREVKCVIAVDDRGKPTSVGLAVELGKKRRKSKAEEKGNEVVQETSSAGKIVEVYDDQRLNLFNAPFGTWTFESGVCAFTEAPGGEEGVMALRYDIPYDDAYCGYFEHLSMGEDCEARPFDTSGYRALTFIAKSGDGQKHRVYPELVAWEKFAEFHQGRTESVGPFEIGEKWKRFEVPLARLYKDTLDPRSIKSVSFKVRREPNYPDRGVILFDNVALIKKQ